MKVKSLLLIIILFSSLCSQNKIYLSAYPGVSILNSENSMKIMGDKHISWFPGISIGYERDNIFGYDLYLEYNMTYNKTNDIVSFYRVPTDSPIKIDTLAMNYTLSFNNLDLGITMKLNKNISYAFGPTISFVSRTVEPDDNFTDVLNLWNLKQGEKLVSVCAGINASLNLEVPFNKGDNYLFFYSSLKFRYLHSIWFDARGRNVSDYYQSFLFGQINLGLGYNF